MTRVAIIVFALLCGMQSADAEDSIGPLKAVQSATYTITQRIGKNPAESTKVKMQGHDFVRAERPDGSIFILDSKKKVMLQLIPDKSSAIITEGISLPNTFNLLDLMAELNRNADKLQPLNQRPQINGVEAIGVETESDGITYRVWMAKETGLPVQIESFRDRASGDKSAPVAAETWSTFAYNVPLSESLFSIEPPVGYSVTTRNYRKMPSPESYVSTETPDSVADLRLLEKQIKGTIKNVKSAVVAVESSLPRKMSLHHEPFGSGVIISKDGLILSQDHVSHGPRTGRRRMPGDHSKIVLFDGRRVNAKLLGSNTLLDISLLQIVEPGPYPYAQMTAPVDVSLGDWVLKLGHPLGYRADRPAVARLGRVLCTVQHSFVTDCPTSGGDSGGPVFNLSGRLVGVIRNSEIPLALRLVHDSKRSYNLYSYTPINAILPSLDSLVAGKLVRWNQVESDQLIAEYSDVSVLQKQQWTRGPEVLSLWKDVLRSHRGVTVAIERLGQQVALGTVVDSEGWVVTKASAIGADCRCRLPDGTLSTPRLVGVHPAFDLALLKLPEHQLSAVDLNAEEALFPGDLIAALGMQADPITCGIVSVGRRDLVDRVAFKVPGRATSRAGHGQSTPAHAAPVVGPHGRRDGFPTVFEHDLPVNSNECGGPVFDLQGGFVGVTIARIGSHGCMAIPADVIRDLLPDLKAGKPSVSLPVRVSHGLPQAQDPSSPTHEEGTATQRAAAAAQKAKEASRRLRNN